METAGKQIDDDELRELMKENGIGRPSTRANIIETLFKRQYIIRNKKQILPTQTGIQLIDIIQSELLKSAELTGQWEKQLKEIEKGNYNAGTFIKNMKNMVDHLVYEVRSEKITANIFHAETAKPAPKKNTVISTGISSEKCPKCNKGSILKGKNAYGCSEFKNGCDFRLPFSFRDKKISENQYIRLLQKKCTVNLKGFKTENGETEGLIRFDEQFNLVLDTSTPLSNLASGSLSNPSAMPKNQNVPDKIACPKCHEGTILKGNTAYGCSDYKNGCDFRFSFDDIRKKAAGQPLTATLVYAILNEKS